MRLFAAVLPPRRALDELGDVVGALRALPDAGQLRWTTPEGRHLALAFYGEVGDDVLPALRERLGRAAGHGRPFTLRLSGGGRFGDRALWAGVTGDVQPLRRLAQAAQAAGRRAGAGGDESPGFRPHLTLARTRTGHWDLRPYLAALEAFEGGEWRAGELTLVRSLLPRGGHPGEQPRYEPVATWPLGAVAEPAAPDPLP